MGENSNIEWTDHTFNPWIGCTKVSPGCAHCYAEARDKRHLIEKVDHWGKGAPRLHTSASNWRQPLKWNQANAECGVRSAERRQRVFCASLGDWLDDEVPIEWLADLLKLIHETPNLDWLLLTKRPENFNRRLAGVFDWFQSGDGPVKRFAAAWLFGEFPANVWIGTTVEDQTRADERIPELLKIPARIRFLSCEPLLGPVDLAFSAFNGADSFGGMPGIHWVICGGESGGGARPMHPQWARGLRDQCTRAEVPFFFKQWGEWGRITAYCARGCGDHPTLPGYMDDNYRIHYLRDDQVLTPITGVLTRLGKHAAGRQLDGRDWSEFPSALRSPSSALHPL